MPNLTLRDVPADLHAWLKRQAGAHHRSVNKEIIVLLETMRQAPLKPAKPGVEEILAIGRECAALPVLDERPADEILGYADNPYGLPQ